MTKDIDHAAFGRLQHDTDLDWWTGTLPHSSPPIAINFSADEQGKPTGALETGLAVLSDIKDWEQRVVAYALQELLPLKNEFWLDENEDSVIASDFKTRMHLESITFYADGDFEFYHRDGDLFCGHAILIGCNLLEGPNDADIPG